MRERQKEQRRLDKIARSYEAAGDIAIARFAYIEAGSQFERALAESHTAEDEARLCEKIGLTLFYGARPDAATPWYERAVLQHCTDEKKAIEIMVRLPRQYWLESRTVEGYDVAMRAYERAKALGEKSLVQRARLIASNYFIVLDRFDEAAPLLAFDEPVEDDPWIRNQWHLQRAIVEAAQGNAEAAFVDFDRAIEVAKQLPDGYQATSTWDEYANWAMALGRIDIARSCRERGLLVARERRIAWRIPHLTLRFAHMLVTIGDYEHARDLLADAMTYDAQTPALQVLKAIVAVELAQALGDKELLKRTHDEETLAYAFRSGEPQRIGPLVAAYVKVAITNGQTRRAKTLIARGMSVMKQADRVGDLLALAARYGMPADATCARELLRKRIELPHHRVAQAYLALWEAYDARRRRASVEVNECVQQAARIFARLGWKHQQADALALTGTPRHVSERKRIGERTPILSDLNPALTAREQQVAELVLRGLTNRAIAQMLSITEHTVESHMTSILNRMGLRSRWQLIELTH
jgi:DNA-binding CsgD family transcriptional regulator/tetratricopeptide (TPR) repeat protein